MAMTAEMNTRISTLIMRGLSATDAALQAAAESGFTGRIYGEVFADTRTNGSAHQVFEYQRGCCTDAYVTKAGHQI